MTEMPAHSIATSYTLHRFYILMRRATISHVLFLMIILFRSLCPDPLLSGYPLLCHLFV